MHTKKKFLVILLFFGIFTLAATAYATENVGVVVNGEVVELEDGALVVVNGRALVSADLFEQLNFRVAWDMQAMQATLTRANDTVIITAGSSTFTLNGTSYPLDVPARFAFGAILLPLRAILESIGYNVQWNSAMQDIIIQTRPFYVTIGGERFSTATTFLDLEDRGLTNEDILHLRYMTNLRLWLALDDNHITDLSPLANLTSLRGLSLMGNPIRDITPLENLTAMESLWMGQNQIADITPLANMPNLRYLGIGLNQVTDLTTLAGLLNLQEVWAWGNPIDYWSPADHVEYVRGRP